MNDMVGRTVVVAFSITSQDDIVATCKLTIT